MTQIFGRGSEYSSAAEQSHLEPAYALLMLMFAHVMLHLICLRYCTEMFMPFGKDGSECMGAGHFFLNMFFKPGRHVEYGLYRNVVAQPALSLDID